MHNFKKHEVKQSIHQVTNFIVAECYIKGNSQNFKVWALTFQIKCISYNLYHPSTHLIKAKNRYHFTAKEV